MGDDLNNLLDDALDCIGSDEEEAQPKSEEAQAGGANLESAVKKAATDTDAAAKESAAAAAKSAEAESLEDSMAKLMQDMQNPEFAQSLDEAMKLFSGEGDDKDTAKALESLLGGAGGGDGEVPEAFKQLAEAAKGLEGADPAETERLGEQIMEEMMGEFEKLGMKDDFASTMENMMKQLISKEVMYTPIQQVCEKFPEWLADNEAKLSKEEYENYGKQYQYFQQIIATYDTEPENSNRIMELMQEMQEYGQPPAEIIKDLAPGLEVGENGMPKLDGLEGFPGMGGDGQPPNCPQM